MHNTIAATIHSNPDLADTLLTRLAALLRAATEMARHPETTLDEEFRLLNAYADIMRQRFADRVTLRVEIDETVRSCRLPTLIMQPLLENAFRHGVERHSVESHSQPTNIRVRAYQAGDRLCLEVQNDRGELPASPVLGVGLSNLQQRLIARYGARANLALSKPVDGGVLARIEMPCEY
jgi:two-component system, LytTR family, sensor kinase